MPKGVYKRKGGLKPRHIAFIRKNRMIMSGYKMARKFKVDNMVVNRWMRKNGLAVPLSLQKKFRAEALVGKTTATKAEDRFIRKHYMTMPEKTMADKLNRSDVFIRTRKRQLGLIVPRHIIEQRIADSRIKPGNVPVNKGKCMSKALYEKCKHTMFKKGNLPGNTLHDGAITVRYGHPDRYGRKYKWIRVGLAKWDMLHVYNWKKVHGPIPKGYIVVFRNGDTMNCQVDNLEMITLATNMKRNTIHRYPVELKQTIIMLGKLGRKIKKHGKEQNSGPEKSSVCTA